MHPYIVRAVRTVAVLSVIALAACGDKEVGSAKLKSLKAGDDRATVLKVLGDGPLTAVNSDTSRLEHGFRRMSYFVNGHQFEVIFYREALGTVTEAVDQAVETPVLLQDQKVLGAGWKYYVEAMTQYGLPSPIVAKVDTPKPDSNAGVTTEGATQAPVVTKKVPTPDSLKKKM